MNNLAANFGLLERHFNQAHTRRKRVDEESIMHEKLEACCSISKDVGQRKHNAADTGVKSEESITKVYTGKGTKISIIRNPTKRIDDLDSPHIGSQSNFMGELRSRLDKLQEKIKYENDISDEDASLVSDEASIVEGLDTNETGTISSELESIFSTLKN
eukprot:CAMPEP_0116010826 /NCGR_PEP_ID=MMETSP0321-20121206/4219_1 /TAXON_ID=163516 /ORGANISM="Leptocylindrus danicus var. danicus, Strain B650" /LENGTH=158 /DNA_ID=CAMNT_0003479973 /DNA_START=467 /DNA_END=943 /DNA_ORIENTATION=+